MSDHFDINNNEPGTDYYYALRAFIGLKDVLVAAGGTVLGSSRGNGKTFGAADYWTIADIEAGNFYNRGAGGAWIAIRLAAGTRTLLLSNYNGTSHGYYWNAAISVDGSWVLGASTSTTIDGTVFNYENLTGTLTPAGAGAGFFPSATDDRGLRWNAFARSDGSFWFAAWIQGSRFMQTFIFVDVLEEYATGDADPAVYGAFYNANGFIYNDGPFRYPGAFFEYDAATYANGDWAQTPGMYYSANGVLIAPGCGNGSYWYGTNRSNPHTGGWDLLPFYYGRAVGNGTVGTYKGKSSLFELSPGNHGLSNLSISADRDRAVFTPLVMKDWVQGETLEF